MTSAIRRSDGQPRNDVTPRRAAMIAGIGLLVMAILAAFAQFVVLKTLVIPGDAGATMSNVTASAGLFRAAIAAFLIVVMLDVVVAWALYVLLRSVNPTLALLTAWLRLVFAAVFGYALVNLLDVARLVGTTSESTLQGDQLNAQVMSSLASFNTAWIGVALAIFGLHLLGLGYLLFRSSYFPRFLGVLVLVAGVGYLADAFGTILVPDYSLTIATFTFVGEAVLIPFLLWNAVKGFPIAKGLPGAVEPPRGQPTAVPS
jgi:hypothetical protein